MAVLTIGPVTSLATCTLTLSGGALCPTPSCRGLVQMRGRGTGCPSLVLVVDRTAPARAASRDERQPCREVVGDGKRAVSHGWARVRYPERRSSPSAPALKRAGPVLVSEMSAKATTGSVAVAVLLARLWSGVVLVTVAVLLKLDARWQTRVEPDIELDGGDLPGRERPQAAGDTGRARAGPLGGLGRDKCHDGWQGVADHHVGRIGRAFVGHQITKRWLRPATVGLVSKLLAMATSAEWVTFEVAVEELFARSGSCVGELTVAVLASVPTARLGLVCTTTSDRHGLERRHCAERARDRRAGIGARAGCRRHRDNCGTCREVIGDGDRPSVCWAGVADRQCVRHLVASHDRFRRMRS